jgi:hypothetical protein
VRLWPRCSDAGAVSGQGQRSREARRWPARTSGVAERPAPAATTDWWTGTKRLTVPSVQTQAGRPSGSAYRRGSAPENASLACFERPRINEKYNGGNYLRGSDHVGNRHHCEHLGERAVSEVSAVVGRWRVPCCRASGRWAGSRWLPSPPQGRAERNPTSKFEMQQNSAICSLESHIVPSFVTPLAGRQTSFPRRPSSPKSCSEGRYNEIWS